MQTHQCISKLSDVRKPASELIANLATSQVLLISTPSTYTFPSKMTVEHHCDIDASIYLTHSETHCPPLYGDQDYEPNHGLLLITRILANEGFSCECLELNVYAKLYQDRLLDIDTNSVLILSFLKQSTKPIIVGISSMTPNLHLAKKISYVIREKSPRSLIVLGGMATCDVSSCFINSGFDVVVEGEGEVSFVGLVRNVINGGKGVTLPGVHYKETHGMNAFFRDPRYPYGQSTVLPAYEVLPRELPLIPRVYLSRGCGNSCDFCSPAAFFRGTVITRKSHAIINDIEQLHARFDFEWFLIGDLTFYLNSKPAREVLHWLSGRKVKPWWAQTQLSFITEDNATLLKQAGCQQLAVGIEDFVISSKAVAMKNTGKARAIRNLEIIKAQGLIVQCYWMFGLPGETLYTSMRKINDMCELIRNGLIDTVHISYYVPYPNTRVVASGEIDQISDDFSPMIGRQSRYYSNMPMHRTRDLSEKEILLLTQLGMACTANEFFAREKE